MAIVAQCTNCGKKYKVAETSVGKQVRCQACQNIFVVAASDATATAQAGSSSASMGAANQKAKQQAQLAQKLGLKPLPKNENEIFPTTPFRRSSSQRDPLANHVVYDAGFAPVSVADYHATQVPKEQSMHDYMKQIEEEEGLEKKSSGDGVSAKGMYMIQGIGPIVCAFIGGLFSLAGLMDVGFWIFAIPTLLIIGMISNIFVWNAIVENDDITQAIMCWFIPFYMVYYVFTNWDHMMHPVLSSMLGGLSAAVGFVLTIMFAFFGFMIWGSPDEALAVSSNSIYLLALLR